MKRKIVMDSAGDIKTMEGACFASVPLKILAGEREFTDDINVDVGNMVSYLKEYKGKSSTACPSVGDYLAAFDDAEEVFCVTITSGLSGSCGAARIAADTYVEQYPQRKVHVLDSLSAGAEMTMVAQKIRELIRLELSFEKIRDAAEEYCQKCKLLFCLESLTNLANNGRVPAAVAKLTGILGIRMIGIASEQGTLQTTGKARGEKKVPGEILKTLVAQGYNGGKMLIHHCFNLPAAQRVKELVLEHFPKAEVAIGVTGALCSFYAELGGLMIGFEA